MIFRPAVPGAGQEAGAVLPYLPSRKQATSPVDAFAGEWTKKRRQSDPSFLWKVLTGRPRSIISPKLQLAELCANFEKSSMRILRGEALGCGRSRGSRAECSWKVPASLTSSTPHPGGRCGSPESCPERRIRVRSPQKRVRIGGEGPTPSVSCVAAAVVAATTRQMRTSVRV